MQKQTPPEATKAVYPILRQIVNLIPPNVFHAAASATMDLSRALTPWSHVVALIYQQRTKTESLNGVCDAARLHASQWQELRGAVPPRRNTFSNANQHRDPTMMETLYWKMLDRASGAPAAARSQVPFEVETELQQTRGSRTSRRLGEAQHRPASRNVWDGRRVEIGRNQAESPVFAGTRGCCPNARKSEKNLNEKPLRALCVPSAFFAFLLQQ